MGVSVLLRAVTGTRSRCALRQRTVSRPGLAVPRAPGYTPRRSWCAALRAAGHGADVIAVTSARDLAVVRRAVSAGVVQYLLKPFGAAALGERLRQYARYRANLDRPGRALGQDEVDRALALLRGTDRSSLPKGLAADTLDTLATALRTAPDGLSAGAAAAATGVSRITARRYLEHLVTTGRATREPRYGQVGRPELGYRWSGG
ncbi:two-component system response regulator [Kitasatospora sp. NA04385]|uniref:two-component system response regulator n=1 Tax=Kitasatospora sp. NA04385 TaxID=2742135 RepID=UPI00158FF386|nr:two-component system response regulator [Kitasatospora sp. NA04385]QKW24551.1 two-component system response regulator [Kitasatospora sp. NA04385]